jgi:hypothetical protein
MAGKFPACFLIYDYAMTINTLTYTLKVWLTSISIAPVSFVVLLFYNDPSRFETSIIALLDAVIGMYLAIVLLEFLFSLIPCLFFLLIVNSIVMSSITEKNKIWIILFVGISLSTATCLLINGFIESDSAPLTLEIINCIYIGSCIWYYRSNIIQIDN